MSQVESKYFAPKLVFPLLLSAGIAILWIFPEFWYRENKMLNDFTWFGETSNAAGWDAYREIAIGQVAEAVLSADRIVNGEFHSSSGARVGVYSAKRFGKKENEIGLFSHTPDRCWTVAGWRMQPCDPDYLAMTIHGVEMVFERRLFQFSGRSELVYFSALVGGRALPYRMNQYFSGASNRSSRAAAGDLSFFGRLFDGRFWGWALSSFANRTPLFGPQQFVRVSTAVESGDIQAADRRLQQLLPEWLTPTNFNNEVAAFGKAGK